MPRSVNPYYSGQPSDHFDGLRFFNPDQLETDRSLRDLLRWKLGGRPAAWPSSVPVQQTVPDASVTGLRATVIGHASVLIQAGGLNVLTDPVWSVRASPLPFAGPRRVWAPGVTFEALPPIDAVLLSHNHYDHMDMLTLRRLNADTLPPVARRHAHTGDGPLEDRIGIGKGGEVTIVPAYHWSARTGRDLRMALWSGFILNTAGGSVHFTGDTGYGNGRIFREVRQRIGRPDMALIPIGSYAPRWFMHPQHTNPEEAVQILEDLEAARAVGIHWGVFRLTDERRDEPPELLVEALERRGIAEDLFPAGQPGVSYESARRVVTST
ncbi:MAG TPA: MBL fold metallo-hydrolase [Gammaproteobacteria bacterium]|nr:MBL fold metallo-hydrolase [Gammaproteobacteria bacterium]